MKSRFILSRYVRHFCVIALMAAPVVHYMSRFEQASTRPYYGQPAWRFAVKRRYMIGSKMFMFKNDTTFPHLLKFHKAAGSFVNAVLWNYIQHDEKLTGTWRNICGEYTTHRLDDFVAGTLPGCSVTRRHIYVAILRDPLHKFISSLYWYAPDEFVFQTPWTKPIANWTEADARMLTYSYDAEFSVPGRKYYHRVPPRQEYVAVLGDNNKEAAIARLLATDVIVAITEDLHSSFVLIALKMGFSPGKFLTCYRTPDTHSCRAKHHWKLGHRPRGSYNDISISAKRHFEQLLADDRAIYDQGVLKNEREKRLFPEFEEALSKFSAVATTAAEQAKARLAQSAVHRN